MSDPGFPEVFCHWFKIGLGFSCHQGKIWSVLITIESGSLLAARRHLHCQGLPCVPDTKKTKPSCPKLLHALRVLCVCCSQRCKPLRKARSEVWNLSEKVLRQRDVSWPLRIQSGGSSNLFLHQQELCCQVSALQSLASLKLLISCGPSRATSSSDCKPFRASLSSCGKVQVISVAFGRSTFSIFVPYIHFWSDGETDGTKCNRLCNKKMWVFLNFFFYFNITRQTFWSLGLPRLIL